jgi:hypothetical protein
MIETVGTRQWSEARIRAFRSCARLGLWTYEVAPQGRSSDAPRAARVARVLSRMTDLSSLVRHVVRGLVVESLGAARGGAPLAIDPDEAIHRLRAIWKDAREHWRDGLPAELPSPDRHRPVFEVLYGEEGDALREIANRAPRCVDAWLRSDLFARLVEASSDDLLWLEPTAADEEDRTAFESDGVRVHAVPDLVWRTDGVTEIVEWRTEPAGADAREHLGPRALWAVAMLGADPGALVARIVHLHEDAREEVHVLGEDDLRAAAERIQRDVVELDSLLGATIDSVPRLDATECVACHFRAACWPEPSGENGA